MRTAALSQLTFRAGGCAISVGPGDVFAALDGMGVSLAEITELHEATFALKLAPRRAFSEMPSGLLYVPTLRWQTPEAFKLAASRSIAIESLADRLGEKRSLPAVLTAPDELRPSTRRARFRPILRVQTGWRWEDVRIRLTIRATMIATHGAERGKHRFAPAEKGEAIRRYPRLFQMLIEISFAGHWQNPAPTTRDYEKVSKSFQRLSQTIEKLIPIPTEVFIRDGDGWRPRFQIQLDEEMKTAARHYRSTKSARPRDGNLGTRKTARADGLAGAAGAVVGGWAGRHPERITNPVRHDPFQASQDFCQS